jgi:acetyl esterase/lipase
MKLSITITVAFLVTGLNSIGQKAMAIWPRTAPGTENWNWKEQEDSSEIPNDLLVYNVAQPTLSFFPANPSIANGTSVIICPGGSFCYLHINTEGAEVAKWLNKIGVSAFVLKYRLVHSETDHPIREKNERMKDAINSAKLVTPIIPMAIADGKQAIAFVRKHASEMGLDSNKVGIMGFSAGGSVATACAFDYSSENRPNFVAPIYAYVPPTLSLNVLKDAPHLFIAAASDDELHLVPMSITLYNKWLAAGRDAEIHIYSKGGHGFGMNKQHQPSDTWIERFGDWLKIQGLLSK